MATGTRHRHLGVPGEKELAGRGVSYCATCDGHFFRDKVVAVVGGSNSAAAAAVHLANLAKMVYIIYRGEQLRAESYWQQLIAAAPNIKVYYQSQVLAIQGKERVEQIKILRNQQEESLALDGIFVEIGLEPNTDLARQLQLELDEEGYIKIKPDGSTSCAGVWAAGDITTGSNKLKQIITAAAEGAIAAQGAFEYLKAQN